MNDVVRILGRLKDQERLYRHKLLGRAESEGLTEQDVLGRDGGPPDEAPPHIHRMWARMKGMERAVGIVNYVATEDVRKQAGEAVLCP